MLNVVSKLSIEGVASTYIGYVGGKRRNLIEFVDSSPAPQSSKDKKWVIIVSSQIGCKMGCRFCDANAYFYGNLKSDEIIDQVDYVIRQNPDINPERVQKFKIQFARMGEPSLNIEVIKAMLRLRERFPNYIPCLATIAPAGSDVFFERLLDIRSLFVDFQLQFSINSTDERVRDYLMPTNKLSFEWIADYIDRFYLSDRRKIVLNFAIDRYATIDTTKLKGLFDPQKAIIKLTPINPTINAKRNGFKFNNKIRDIEQYLKRVSESISLAGFETIISIGDLRENQVLSNCGQTAQIRLLSYKLHEYRFHNSRSR